MTEYVWQHDLEGERDRLRLMSDLLDPSSEFHLMGTGVTAGWRCLEIGAAVLPSMRRRRYTAGKVARQISLLRRFAPAEMFDKSLRKQMRLGDALERD